MSFPFDPTRLYPANIREKGIMSLVTRLAAPPAPKASRSVLDTWIEKLNTQDRAAVEAAILNPEWRHIDLKRVLEAEGAPKIAETTFGAWRRKHANDAQ